MKGIRDNSKISQVVEKIRNGFLAGDAVDVNADSRIVLTIGFERWEENTAKRSLAGSDGDLTILQMGHVLKLSFRTDDVLDSFLNMCKEEFTLMGQRDSLVAADEELTAKLLLQLIDDPRDVWLTVVQNAGGHGKAFAGGNMIENPVGFVRCRHWGFLHIKS